MTAMQPLHMNPTPVRLQVSLGPVLYYWDRATLMDFYARAAQSALDVVYVGEAVCSKRRALKTDEWITLARDLAAGSGKQVVLSSLALIEAESELGQLRRQVRELAREPGVLLEANDFGAVQAASDAGVPFVAGHTLNVYNAGTLMRLQKRGAVRWVPPVELSREGIAAVITAAGEDGSAVPTEVFAWGRLPLAHSARCFTARAANVGKDQCGFRCGDISPPRNNLEFDQTRYPEGLPLASREGQPLFRLNGIQTQSESHCNLFGESADMRRRGIDMLRISVSTPADWPRIDRLIAQAHGDADALLAVDAEASNGYWFGHAGMANA
jgi:collagenase-like PrtC family protease